MISMLDKMQKSTNFWQLEQQILGALLANYGCLWWLFLKTLYLFLAIQSDIALIWSAATSNQSLTYEFTPFVGMGVYQSATGTPQVATNYFQAETWGSLIPPANDFLSWNGITRAKNLRQLLVAGGHNFETLKILMDRTIEQGGAKWGDTAYQLLYDPKNAVLLLKTQFTQGWKVLNLQAFWNTV